MDLAEGMAVLSGRRKDSLFLAAKVVWQLKHGHLQFLLSPSFHKFINQGLMTFVHAASYDRREDLST